MKVLLSCNLIVYKVDEPNLVVYLNWTPILEWYVISLWLQNDIYQKEHMLYKNHTTCSKYDNHSKLFCQHNWDNMYGHCSMST